MERLAETNNRRIVDLNKEEGIGNAYYINTPSGITIMIRKPVFIVNQLDITIGDMFCYATRKLGRLLGMFVGDGWVDNPEGTGHMLCLATIHLSMVDFYRESVNEYLRHGKPPVLGYHQKNSTHSFEDYESTHGKFSIGIALTERKAMVEMFGHRAANKTFPDNFLNTPEEFRWGFLSGLIDTDGSISLHIRKQKNGKLKYNKDARYSTTSRKLAGKVQLLAFSLGINASITSSPHNDGALEYIVLFSTKHITEKRDNLSLFHEENALALSKFTLSKRAYYKDIVPFDKDIFTVIKKENVGLREPILQAFRNAFRKGYVPRDSISPFYKDGVKSLYDSRYDYNVDYEVIEKIV